MNPVKIFNAGSHNNLSALALRVPLGAIFVAYGAQKLFGWFAGYGLEGTGGFSGDRLLAHR